MTDQAAVTVIGIGDDGWTGLTDEARTALRGAPVIAGAARHLALLPDLQVRRVPLPSPLLPQLDQLVADAPGLCVLASGDPMLHGVGATLARRLGAGQIRVLPAVSCVALACARLGWAEHEVDVVSVVSRPVEVILPAVQPGSRVIVLCRDGSTPAALAALLADRGWGGTQLTVLEHLGGEREQVRGPYPAGAPGRGPFADLSVVALECVPDSPAAVLPRVPGLPDGAYESDGQLTRREVRALALAALGPGPRPAPLGRRGGQRQRRHRVDAGGPARPGGRYRSAARPGRAHPPQRGPPGRARPRGGAGAGPGCAGRPAGA